MKAEFGSVASATRGRIALTHRGVEGLRAETIAYRICDMRCRGLAVRVAPSGSKTWDVAFRITGTGAYRRLSLGPFPAVGLDAARARTLALTNAARTGRDLVAEEKAAKTAAAARLTIGQLVELYLSRRVRGRLRSAAEMERRFARTFAPLKDRYADEVRRRDLRELLDKVVDRGAPREAQQRRQVARVMFRWALSQDLVEIDPTAGLASYGTSPRRNRVLDATEIQLVWNWLSNGAVPEGYAEALKLQLATGARIGEVAGIQAAEIDRETWLWTLPENRSKNGRPRVTPLVGLAREIVEPRLHSSPDGPLFWSERGLRLDSNLVASMLVKHRKKLPVDHFTSHDLRRTVATGLVDLGIPYELVAGVLGHEVGAREVKTLIRHYVRTDLIERKRNALLAWDAKLRQIVYGGPLAENVTYLPKTSVQA